MHARRLADRIRALAAEIAKRGAAPESEGFVERLKIDITEYFSREANPCYTVERRSGSPRSIPGENGGG